MTPIQSPDSAFYERVAGALEAAGFALLGDMPDLTAERSGGAAMPTVARFFAGDDGSVTAAIYPTRGHGAAAEGVGHPHVIELETPLDDGVFLMTSNAADMDVGGGPPQLKEEVMPPGTTVDQLLDRHRIRVAEWLRTRPTVGPLHSRSIEDAIAHHRRVDRLRSAFRRE